MPASDPEIRARLEAEIRRDGLESLHARLARVDPVAAARIHATDPQRILRALEVYEQTGEPMSRLHARGRNAGLPYRLLKLALLPVIGYVYLKWFHVTGLPFKIGMLFFCLPTSTALYVLSSQLDSDTRLASASIALSTMLSFVPLSISLLL